MSPENTFEFMCEYLFGAPGADPHARTAFLRNVEATSGQDLLRVVNGLPHALEAQPAPAELKARILSALANEEAAARASAPESLAPAPHVAPEGALFIQRAHEGKWVNPGIPGVMFKNLFVDHHTGYVTMLVRMAPGSSFPTHRHTGYEECLMLEGEVRCGEIQLFAGDYQRMIGDTVHEPLYSKTGCTFLVVASEHNELI
jgi:anti-sigma factor ChrR (cupin superfamily)